MNFIVENNKKTQGQLITKRVQNLVDECSFSGGGKIIFPKGEYVLSTVFLKSNVEIVLEEGAVILGAENFDDYCFHEELDFPLYQDQSHSFFHCSMFVGIGVDNIAITGRGKIDMRSVWDEEDKRGIRHRGPKVIALKRCDNVKVSGIGIYNATDLAVYFTGCNNVEVCDLRMSVYIDGISPDNSKNVYIHDCEVEAGDDGIVFKSSYNMNKFDICENILVENCVVKSRCSAIKFGTETNGGFENITIKDILIKETRLCGIAIESVDGAVIKNLLIKDINMYNVSTPLFVYLGDRMRAPEGTPVGKISDVVIENVKAYGPYEPYNIVPLNYFAFKDNSYVQYPWMDAMNHTEEESEKFKDVYWQTTSNVMGLRDNPIKNLTLRNIEFKLQGGCKEYMKEVPHATAAYPEVNMNGKALPAKGIFFRNVDGLILDNVKIETYLDDVRKDDFVFENIANYKVV